MRRAERFLVDLKQIVQTDGSLATLQKGCEQCAVLSTGFAVPNAGPRDFSNIVDHACLSDEFAA
jgi:hypothetical protein